MSERSKEVQIGGKTYTIHKFRPTEGRRIIAGYPVTALPKFGDYDRNEEIMFRLMSHVEVHVAGGRTLKLETQALIDNHVGSWENLVELEFAALKFNCPFLDGDNMKPFAEMVSEFAAGYLADIMTRAMGMVGNAAEVPKE
ncbi:tail assembly chaperone protein [Aeromonas phage Gekk3-15]